MNCRTYSYWYNISDSVKENI
uniref:Uncharacterized protein n=1 Tax=Rhizophora mucronata TaxID=61149 RepID=A0A2P2NK48_RHIMU